MKTILKAVPMLVLVAIVSSSCSVEYKTRHGKKNAIDVGMNEKDSQNNIAVVAVAHSNAAVAGR